MLHNFGDLGRHLQGLLPIALASYDRKAGELGPSWSMLRETLGVKRSYLGFRV